MNSNIYASDYDDTLFWEIDSQFDEMMATFSSNSPKSPGSSSPSTKSDDFSNQDEMKSSKPATVIKKSRFRPNKKRYPARLFPRVIKRDLRRLYPTMLANILNASDPMLIRSFFHTYSAPTFDIIGEKEVFVNNSYIPKPPIGDVDNMAYNFAIEQELMPDLAVKLDGACIKQFLNDKSHSEVMCQITFSGTKLFRYERTSSCKKQAIEIDEYLDKLCSSEQTNNDQIEDVNAYTPHLSSLSTSNKLLLSNPFEIFIKGVLTLLIDDRNRISGIKFGNCH